VIGRGRWRAALAVVAVVIGAGAVLRAHPTATSYVTIAVPGDGQAHVTIVADARGLLLKLDGDAARAAGRVTLIVDTSPVTLRVDRVDPVANRPEAIAIRMTGTLPAVFSSVAWQSTLFGGAYPVSIAASVPDERSPDDYEWLEGAERSRDHPYPFSAGGFDGGGFWRLTRIGFAHIVPDGLDHVLFVLGLFLLAASIRDLLLQITAFTLAHSITLALAYSGVVSAPAALVEPLIALSIAWIAFENLFATGLSRGRLVVVAAFGLLHGLGFATALSGLGLSGRSFVATLAGFNLGVELGQIAVVIVAACVLAPWRVDEPARRRWIVRPASLAIAVTGLFWAGQRLLA
jgi:hypothetical protein